MIFPEGLFRQFQYPTPPEHADLAIKEAALARTARQPLARRRYRPPDRLLAFLEAL
ncbi:MAG TPA: hypothetical protein VNG13_10490 [Mycobacteriales bacterium]|nr:hypothetical protein [Mycobacteriales bacterium]